MQKTLKVEKKKDYDIVYAMYWDCSFWYYRFYILAEFSTLENLFWCRDPLPVQYYQIKAESV